MTRTMDFLSALDEALLADASLNSVLQGIYDDVPDSAASPYVVYGVDQETEGRLMDRTERTLYLALHIWSDYAGWKEVLEIRDLLVSVIGNGIGVGEKFCWMLFENFETVRDPSGWRHGILTYRIYLDEE